MAELASLSEREASSPPLEYSRPQSLVGGQLWPAAYPFQVTFGRYPDLLHLGAQQPLAPTSRLPKLRP